MNIVLKRNGGRGVLAPYYESFGLLRDMEELASELWDSWRPVEFVTDFTPTLDMYEEKGKLVIKTELPGIKKEDVDVSLEGDTLTVKAEKKEETKEDESTHHISERRYGQYYRSVTLPFPVKEDEISAVLDGGVLEIKLPKSEELAARKIEVKSQTRAQLPRSRRKSKKEK